MAGSAYGQRFAAARAAALRRSGGTCQLCGRRAATEAHHWAVEYPPAESLTHADLTALCSVCHQVATLIRRHERTGGTAFEIKRALQEILNRCNTA